MLRDWSVSLRLQSHGAPNANIGAAGDSWPDLLAVLFQLSIAAEAGKRETAFRVFTTTPGIIEKQHEDAVAQAFTRGFKDDSVVVCDLSTLPYNSPLQLSLARTGQLTAS